MSFRLKTIIGIALIEGSLLLFLVLSGIKYLTESSEEELALRARVTAESMANLTRDAVLATDLARLDSVVTQTLASPGIVYVRIMDSERVLAEAGKPQILERAFVADSRLDAIEDGVFDVGVDMVEEDFSFGRVELGLSVERVNSVITAAQRHLSGIAAVEIILVALFSFALGTYLTRGLNNLAHAARAIAEGKLGTRVDIKGEDELAETGEAFNIMSQRLAESKHAMQNSIKESEALAGELAEKELRLSTILDTAVDGFVTIDSHGIIDTINPAGARLFGYEAGELVGRNVSCLMPEPYSTEHDGYLHRYLETGEARIIGKGRRVTGQRKDGSTFPMNLSISEMFLDDRRMFVGLVRDITEKVQTEASAHRNEVMRSAIVDTNLDGIVTIDASSHIIEFSPVAEEIFGYQRKDVMGKSMTELIIPPEMRDMHNSGMQKYLETGEGAILGNRIEVPALRADGEQFPMELTVQAVEVGDETFFTATVRDISEHKAREQALVDAREKAEVASRAKSRFLAHMSHEIRSPMNAVLGSLGLLLEDELTKDQRLYARTAQASSKVLLSVINNILDFSKIEAGHLELDNMDFSVYELISDAMDLVALKARDKALPVVASVAPDVDTWVRGDMARLRQILVNLLDNALKFTEQGGVILRVEQLRVRDDGPDLRFTVEDTGIGITAESQATLFEEFRQVDNSDSTRHGGTGLGLAICKALADVMGGSITIDSVPGRGSRFWIDIPLQTPSAGHVQRPAPSCGLRSGLAIGFHPLIASALVNACTAAGCTFASADSLEHDVAGPEVILVDSRLTDGELDDIARHARMIGVQRLLLLVADGNPAALQRISDGQYDDMITTPLLIADLLESMALQPGRDIERPSRRAPDLPTSHAGGEDIRLLLAEDSMANQLVASAMLRNAGYTVDIANNGREAIDMFRQGDYSAILMDLRMPQVDGLEATAAIRAMPGGGQVPIIAMTANVMKEDIDRCMNAGMNYFVPKPVNKRLLLETLANVIAPGPAGVGEPAESPPMETGSDTPLLDEQVFQQLADDVTPDMVPVMMQMFIDEMVQRAGNLSAALDDSSMDTVENEAHTLKSSAGTFGAARLHELASDIEVACRAGNRSHARDLGNSVNDVMQLTLAKYREHFTYLQDNNELEETVE
ncbi:MAG: PAS domain S-box protein [Gammaproteobacteria bacterium]|nr:PAS domain S-box protein [Gammaproteobacteria bacterium]